MTVCLKILWCLKAVMLGEIYTTLNASHLVASSDLLFSVFQPSDKEIFVLLSISKMVR